MQAHRGVRHLQVDVPDPDSADGASKSDSPDQAMPPPQQPKPSIQTRKRRSDSASNTGAEHSGDACDAEDDRKERKRLSNRESARRMRLQRQESRRRLDARLTQLTAANERLEARAQALEQHSKQLAAGLQHIYTEQKRMRTLPDNLTAAVPAMAAPGLAAGVLAEAPAAAAGTAAVAAAAGCVVPDFMDASAAEQAGWDAVSPAAHICSGTGSSCLADAMRAAEQDELVGLYEAWLSGYEVAANNALGPSADDPMAQQPQAATALLPAATAAAAPAAVAVPVAPAAALVASSAAAAAAVPDVPALTPSSPAAPSHGAAVTAHGDLLEQLASLMGISSGSGDGEASGCMAEPSSCRSARTGGDGAQPLVQPWLLLPQTQPMQ